MSGRGEKDARSLALTRRGVVQLVLAATLLATGLVGGWLAPGAVGIALLAGCLMGLADVLLARRLGRRGRRVTPLAEQSARVESWVRVNQRGTVIERLARPGTRRGLYRQQSVLTTWTDAFGFWRATRVEPVGREVRVPPAVSPRLLREVIDGSMSWLAEREPEQDRVSVRPYEKGDGIRQISWRQTAHHGQLMSFEQSGRDGPPVLVVADATDAGDADGLAATLSALLQGLRRVPDVLLTDGTQTLRTPVQQERFCAAVVGERAGTVPVDERAREVARLAGVGSERRRVVLVTCDPDGAMARSLRVGPLSGSVTVVRAEGATGADEAREGPAEKTDERAAIAAGRAVTRQDGAAELVALLACVAIALLTSVPLTSMIYEGAWGGYVPALLCAGAASGSLLGSLLRWRGTRTPIRVVLLFVLAVALAAVGTALALGALDGRVGPLAVSGTEPVAYRTVWDEPVDWLLTILTTGSEQLAGTGFDGVAETWDLLVVLMGGGLAALLALLASSRALRGSVALVPLALSAVDQSIMGPSAHLEWTWAYVALGLLLVWLSVSARPRPARGLLVALVACALGWGASAVAPSRSFSPWSAGGARVETLVDLSRDLRSRSDDPVLTYDTTALGPVYLRIGVLDTFDGATWRFEGRDDAAVEENSALYWAGRSQGIEDEAFAASLAPFVTTTLVPDETNEQDLPAPPGTATELLNDDGSLVASGCYLSPITGASYLDTLLRLAPSLERYDSRGDGPDERATAVPEQLPEEIASVVDRARDEGMAASTDNIVSEVEAVRWLVSFFTDGSFSYSLDAPGGDGRDNLEAVNDFLVEREGYCTHYATAFALLARELGVPARVALGYAPSSARDGGGDYVVTMRQLHAWAEVWFDGVGWVGVDVTPAADGGGAAPEPEETPEVEPSETEPEPEETPAEPEEETPQQDTLAEEDEKDDGPSVPWQTAVLLGLAVLVLGGGAAALLVRHRRAANWQTVWRRICRKAWRSGVRWDKSATEDVIVERICEQLNDDARAAEVRKVARNACQERYG